MNDMQIEGLMAMSILTAKAGMNWRRGEAEELCSGLIEADSWICTQIFSIDLSPPVLRQRSGDKASTKAIYSLDEIRQIRCKGRRERVQGQSDMGHLHKFRLETVKEKNSILQGTLWKTV